MDLNQIEVCKSVVCKRVPIAGYKTKYTPLANFEENVLARFINWITKHEMCDLIKNDGGLDEIPIYVRGTDGEYKIISNAIIGIAADLIAIGMTPVVFTEYVEIVATTLMYEVEKDNLFKVVIVDDFSNITFFDAIFIYIKMIS